MVTHEVLVVGGGTGNNVAAAAAAAGLDTGLVERGPLGGTCLNRGCNPSKMLIQAAHAVRDVRTADRFHVDAEFRGVDVAAVVDGMDETLSAVAAGMEDRYREKSDLTLYDDEATFVDDRTVEVGGERVSGERVVVATGSRPLVPPIDGLDEVSYMTSDEALYRRELPDSLVVLGGGYIAVELGYYFDAMGVDVRIVEANDRLVSREDPDVAETFTTIARERHEVTTGHLATAVEATAGGVRARAEAEDGSEAIVEGEALLVAVGRRPNTDGLGLAATGVETDDRGFVETDDRLRTSAANVWALGDVAGNQLFKHGGDYETDRLIETVVHDRPSAVDYSALPHAIFTEPEIAGVGATERDLRDGETDYVVGRAEYADTPMGRAKKIAEGFVKVLAAPDGEILGCTAIGPEASVLIHEVVVPMRTGEGHVDEVRETIHAHPTLNKVVEAAFDDVPV